MSKQHPEQTKIDNSVSNQKVHHGKFRSAERPISSAYPAIDTDLGRDNLENHLPEADLQDL